jgi:hypothetical protein
MLKQGVIDHNLNLKTEEPRMKDLAASQALPPVSDFMKQTIDIVPRRKVTVHRTRDSIYDDLELIGDRDQQSEVMFAASNTHNSNQAGALL